MSFCCCIATHAGQFQGDSTRIAVGGDSGGGILAAAVTLIGRDRGGPVLTFQLLCCPLTDFRISTSSWKEYDGYMLYSKEFLIFRDFYFSHEKEQMLPYAAPSLAPDLHALPPALIITAECDPLRDGGEQYGQRLRDAGVPATVSRYAGMVHNFMHMSAIVPTQADQAFAEASGALRNAFAFLDDKR
jgi:acetyl esterase